MALLLLTGCNHIVGKETDYRAGMLVETTIHDKAWGQKGYKGLQSIHEKYGVDVYFKEGVKTYSQTIQSVEELVENGVNVIFGHSNVYGEYFRKMHKRYPDVHFFYFNGEFSAENVTSLNFSAHAMGFFGGMVAGRMTETNEVGLIGVFEWQPEVEGFYEGVMYQNPEAEVHINFTYSWEDKERAMKIYEQMKKEGADVFYPAGDLFTIPLIHQIQIDQHYAIGYLSDQHAIAENTVLTSTVQQVEKVYALAMERFIKGDLPGEPITFDFQDGAIALGEFSSVVPKRFKKEINQSVERYIESGKLPNEQ